MTRNQVALRGSWVRIPPSPSGKNPFVCQVKRAFLLFMSDIFAKMYNNMTWRPKLYIFLKARCIRNLKLKGFIHVFWRGLGCFELKCIILQIFLRFIYIGYCVWVFESAVLIDQRIHVLNFSKNVYNITIRGIFYTSAILKHIRLSGYCFERTYLYNTFLWLCDFCAYLHIKERQLLYI